MNKTNLENVSICDTEDDNVDDDEELVTKGIQMKEILVVAFIMGIWFYSLYRYRYLFTKLI